MARKGAAVGGPSTWMRSPPFSFSDALAAASFTSTLPATISCCTRARLTSGSWLTRNWSSRRPACSGGTSNVIGLVPGMKAIILARTWRAEMLQATSAVLFRSRHSIAGFQDLRHLFQEHGGMHRLGQQLEAVSLALRRLQHVCGGGLPGDQQDGALREFSANGDGHLDAAHARHHHVG